MTENSKPFSKGKTTPGDRWTPAQTEILFNGKSLTFHVSLVVDEIINDLNNAYKYGFQSAK